MNKKNIIVIFSCLTLATACQDSAVVTSLTDPNNQMRPKEPAQDISSIKTLLDSDGKYITIGNGYGKLFSKDNLYYIDHCQLKKISLTTNEESILAGVKDDCNTTSGDSSATRIYYGKVLWEDAVENIYIQEMNSSIRKIYPNGASENYVGIPWGSYGGSDGDLASALIDSISSAVIDSQGDVYFLQGTYDNSQSAYIYSFRKISNGRIDTLASAPNTGNVPAWLYSQRLVINPHNDNIYFLANQSIFLFDKTQSTASAIIDYINDIGNNSLYEAPGGMFFNPQNPDRAYLSFGVGYYSQACLLVSIELSSKVVKTITKPGQLNCLNSDGPLTSPNTYIPAMIGLYARAEGRNLHLYGIESYVGLIKDIYLKDELDFELP